MRQQAAGLDERHHGDDLRLFRGVGLGFAPIRDLTVACEVTASMRVRSSRSNPFSTDITTMSTATPSARPITDIEATNETKPLRCAERR
jgi:hypothetical protein